MRQMREKSSLKMKAVNKAEVNDERISMPMEDESIQLDQIDYDYVGQSHRNGLHQSHPGYSRNGDTLLQGPTPFKSMSFRSSDSELNVGQAAPPPPSRQLKKLQTTTPPIVYQSGAVGDRLYRRSASSSSMYSSGSSKGGKHREKTSKSPFLEEGLHQVRWADTDQQGSRSRHTGVATASTASSSLSEIPDSDNNRQGPFTISNKKKSSRLSPTAPSRVVNTGNSDGFGKVVKSPKVAQKVIKSAPPPTSRRRNRNVEADQRISQADAFEPSEDLFGDFANPGTPSGHQKRSSWTTSDIGDTMKELYPTEDVMRTKSPEKRRLWASMSHINSSYEEEEEGQNDTRTIVTTGNATYPLKGKAASTARKTKNGVSLKGDKIGSNSSNANDANKSKDKKSPILPGQSSSTGEIHIAGANDPTKVNKAGSNKVANKSRQRIELAPTNIVSISSPVAVVSKANEGSKLSPTDLASTPKPTAKKSMKYKLRRRNSDPSSLGTTLESNTTHSPTLTVTTTGMTSVATNRTSSSAPAASLQMETISKDDLFLIAMEKFAARVASKTARAELKAEKSKMKKQKSARNKFAKNKNRRRSSLGGDVEFNVEDQTDFFEDGQEDDDDDEDALLAEFAKTHYIEIDWNPPEFVEGELQALTMARQGRSIGRRASAPASWNAAPYEPVTPSFVYYKGKRKSSKIGGSVVPAYIAPPFSEEDDYLMEETATAVDTILNQGKFAAHDDFVDGAGGRPGRQLSVAESMLLLDQQSSKSRLLSSQSQLDISYPTTDKKPSFRAPSGMKLDTPMQSGSERMMAQTERSSHAKAKRRGSTSVLEVSSTRSTSAPEDPECSRLDWIGEKECQSRSRTKSPSTRKSTRSKAKISTNRTTKRRGSVPEPSTSPGPEVRPSLRKKSLSRRRSTSVTQVDRRKRSKSPQHSTMTRLDKHSSAPRVSTSDKKGRRKSVDAGPSSTITNGMRSSIPLPTTSQGDQTKDLDISKSRSTSRLPKQSGLSQSALVVATGEKKKEKIRSKGPGPKTHSGRRKSEDGGTTATTTISKPSKERKRSKSPKLSQRRASLDSIEAERTKHQPSDQSSWSGLTLSSVQPLEHVYSGSALLRSHEAGETSDEELDILR